LHTYLLGGVDVASLPRVARGVGGGGGGKSDSCASQMAVAEDLLMVSLSGPGLLISLHLHVPGQSRMIYVSVCSSRTPTVSLPSQTETVRWWGGWAVIRRQRASKGSAYGFVKARGRSCGQELGNCKGGKGW
jgi:hypothetical protein